MTFAEKWDWDNIIKSGKDHEHDFIEDIPPNMNYCSCGYEFTNILNTLKCVKCGIVRNIEGVYNDGYSIVENPFMNTVTISGVGSKVYRSNVYKSGHFSENDLRIKRNLIYEELVKLYDIYKSNNDCKLNITKNHLTDTARLYSLMISPSNNQISNNTDTYGFTDDYDIIRYREYVLNIKNKIYKDEKKRIILRSTNKKEALAALLSHVLLSEGITCQKSAIPTMLQLGQDGCAAGEAQIMKRSHILNMDIDLNIDRIGPEVDTLFNNIKQKYFTITTEELEDEFKNLRLAIYEIHSIFESKFIADRSCPKSQIIGATYVIMRRCKNKKLIPIVPPIMVYCNELIRKPTVEKLIIEMNKFHSYFVDVYKKYNLDDTKWKTI
jgi:hypothetical protein